MSRRISAVILLLLVLAAPLSAQDMQGFGFKVVSEVPTTPVKNQARTGTCWCFATTSFFETELIREGKPALDLSEMYTVRMNYAEKTANYVRMHGEAALGEGSVAGDVLRQIREHGMVPEAVYEGRRYGSAQHDHSELHAVLKGAVDALIQRRQLQPVWPDAVAGILNAYLGVPPDTFTYNGKRYTPATFRDWLGVKTEDYIELTSFTHHPFNTWFAVEIPDNWARNRSFNIPLDDLMGVIDNALQHGYSVAWDGDVSERSFCQAKGVAVWPQKAWEARDQDEQKTLCNAPEAEVQVTQALRQKGFDNFTTSDDHLMHIIGSARDRNGETYYITKNSWGETGPAKGYIYMSAPYVRAKTISIVVNRAALPAPVTNRLAAAADN